MSLARMVLGQLGLGAGKKGNGRGVSDRETDRDDRWWSPLTSRELGLNKDLLDASDAAVELVVELLEVFKRDTVSLRREDGTRGQGRC